jgi:hypothetical protein
MFFIMMAKIVDEFDGPGLNADCLCTKIGFPMARMLAKI